MGVVGHVVCGFWNSGNGLVDYVVCGVWNSGNGVVGHMISKVWYSGNGLVGISMCCSCGAEKVEHVFYALGNIRIYVKLFKKIINAWSI